MTDRPVLRLGSTGPAVAELQELLGIGAAFGPKTEAAVRRFQAAHGLGVDGVVGNGQTWPALLADEQPPPTLPDVGASLDKRALACTIARSWLGRTDSATVWESVHAKGPPFPAYWCWAFVLMCWREAGICAWDFSKGVFLLSTKLPTTRDPQPGDCAYFAAHQHHALVVRRDSAILDWVNGNGGAAPGTVTLSERRHMSDVTVFYSIASLL